MYSRSQVALALNHWREIRSTLRLPARAGMPPGYRGRSAGGEPAWSHAVRLYVDLETAITRLDRRVRLLVYRRYWLGARVHRATALLVEAVWRSMNGLEAS